MWPMNPVLPFKCHDRPMRDELAPSIVGPSKRRGAQRERDRIRFELRDVNLFAKAAASPVFPFDPS